MGPDGPMGWKFNASCALSSLSTFLVDCTQDTKHIINKAGNVALQWATTPNKLFLIRKCCKLHVRTKIFKKNSFASEVIYNVFNLSKYNHRTTLLEGLCPAVTKVGPISEITGISRWDAMIRLNCRRAWRYQRGNQKT